MKLMLPLKDQTIYKDGRGSEIVIMGPTRDYADFVWSLQGDWYVRATGERLGYCIVRDADGKDIGGEHFSYGPDSPLRLVREVGRYRITAYTK